MKWKNNMFDKYRIFFLSLEDILHFLEKVCEKLCVNRDLNFTLSTDYDKYLPLYRMRTNWQSISYTLLMSYL